MLSSFIRHLTRASGAVLLALLLALVTPAAHAQLVPPSAGFGPNVLLFNPSMPIAQIQAKVDAIAAQQVSNQFGPQRYALLFAPGTYGTAAQPLTFQIGYYTEVAGLGANPGDVIINGHIDVYNQCSTNNI